MDTHHAIIVGRENIDAGEFVILARANGEDTTNNGSEKNENKKNQQTVQAKFFKEVASHFQNATHLHVTGTGQAQEQFIHYLAETPQFKNTKTEDSTSNRMTDEKLLEFFSGKLN